MSMLYVSNEDNEEGLPTDDKPPKKPPPPPPDEG